MTELEWINTTAYINASIAIMNLEAPEHDENSDYTNPLNYNLIEDATAECLSGDCEHYCGEPTQYDLERMEKNGKADLVEAYENNVQYI